MAEVTVYGIIQYPIWNFLSINVGLIYKRIVDVLLLYSAAQSV